MTRGTKILWLWHEERVPTEPVLALSKKPGGAAPSSSSSSLAMAQRMWTLESSSPARRIRMLDMVKTILAAEVWNVSGFKLCHARGRWPEPAYQQAGNGPSGYRP